jgi:hypothetical protein
MFLRRPKMPSDCRCRKPSKADKITARDLSTAVIAMNDFDDLDELRRRLEMLRVEHRDLDDVIARLIEKAPFDQLQLRRLKKRKLGLKDTIIRIEGQLRPDIIA